MHDRLIPYGRQSLDEADITAVVETLKSDFLTQGPTVERFENLICEYSGAEYAVAVNSATSALHLACLALGVGPGSRVWTVPNTFVASANCARYCGAEVGFVDIHPNTYNLDTEVLAMQLEIAAANSRLPSVVVAVDFAGQPCNWDHLRQLKAKYGFRLIDDASHALGATFQGRPTGSLDSVDITVFSFHPVKIIATGEGGAAATSDPMLARKLAALRSHGIVRDENQYELIADGPWYYEQQQLGFNYRMTDIQAALGCSQIHKLEGFLQRRKQLASRYDTLLKDLPVVTPRQSENSESAWHLYVIQVEADHRRQIFENMRRSGIGVQVHYIPVHLQPYYRRLGFRPGDFPVSEDYYRRAISLPIYPALSEEQQDRVIDCLREALAHSQ